MIDNDIKFKKTNLTLNEKNLNWLLQIWLLITIFLVFVPLSPLMPSAGLDPSWQFAMNQALAQGLDIGKDVVFTFGPYASIYTKLYSPETYWLMIFGSVFIALVYWLVLYQITSNSKWYLLLATIALFAGFNYSRDALLFSYPLLLGIYYGLSINSSREFSSKTTWLITAIIFAPLGLIPLIKGSMLIICVLVAGLISTMLILQRRYILVLVAALSTITSIISFWYFSGQSILNLPNYFISIIPIISGYSDAMSVSGHDQEILFFLLASFFLILAVVKEINLGINAKYFIALIYLIYLFLAFKAGFVRHDGHATIASTSLLIAAIYWVLISKSRYTYVVLIASVAASLIISKNYIGAPSESIYNSLRSTYNLAKIKSKDSLEQQYNRSLEALKISSGIPLLKGDTDIYSYDQTLLFASGNEWDPRPVFQSYSVYTPELAEENKHHLLGANAPDNILFSVQPIDGRLPSMEDGASWPVLLSHYQPTKFANGYVYLVKNKQQPSAETEPVIGAGSYAFGEEVPVPPSKFPVFVEISIKLNLLGKMTNILYKPSHLQIKLNLVDGSSRTYRIISGMAKTGFIISPMVADSSEFLMLYDGDIFLANNKVKSLSITPSGGGWQWIKSYSVKFKSIIYKNKPFVISLIKTNQKVEFPRTSRTTLAGTCDGSIDVINGVSPAPSHFSGSGLLKVSGWVSTNLKQGILPKNVFLVLSGAHGENLFFSTSKTPRSDVGAYFRDPKLDMSGYESLIDTSSLSGGYILRLAYEDQSGDVKVCPQFNIPAEFHGH